MAEMVLTKCKFTHHHFFVCISIVSIFRMKSLFQSCSEENDAMVRTSNADSYSLNKWVNVLECVCDLLCNKCHRLVCETTVALHYAYWYWWWWAVSWFKLSLDNSQVVGASRQMMTITITFRLFPQKSFAGSTVSLWKVAFIHTWRKWFKWFKIISSFFVWHYESKKVNKKCHNFMSKLSLYVISIFFSLFLIVPLKIIGL